ncbi:MAG: nicotinamide riboside transporter PnuC [Muribaculaceae bacterium]|nr:nicotinamide riboside transporter PnuC [Muribaculaceae bacterium]
MDFSTFRELLGFCVGILYLWWEYHADAKVWLASVVMPMISMWIYFSKGLYADFAINIYYLVIAIYGFAVWTRGGKKKNKDESEEERENNEKGTRKITHVGVKVASLCAVSALLIWYVIWWILVSFTDSTVPVADSFTTALSIVGLWMMARKYVEQWLVWLVVDVVCSALYLYKELPFYCALYAIYTVVALLGYRKWLRLMKSGI